MSKSDAQIQQESNRKIAAQTRKAFPPTSGKGSGVADWTNASSDVVLRLVCLVAAEGGAVRLGYTRDGGAYSIGIYLGENSKTYYCNEKDGINEKIGELIEYFEQ